jgi:uncharacterized protein involved in exopolysaccharide biosynthesis
MFVERHRETLDQLREVVRRRAGAAAVVFSAVLAAGGAASVALPPLYRAAAVLAVEPGRSDPELPGELSARLDTISQRVLSRTPLLDQARRFSLYPELATRGLSDAVVEQMKSDIRLEAKATADPSGRGTLVGVSLSYRGRDPAIAARVSNDLAALYLEQDALLRSQRYAGRAELLKHRLTEMKQRLDEHGEPALEQDPPHAVGGRRLVTDAGALEHLSGQLRALRDERLRTLERRDGLLKQLAEADPHTGASTRIEGLRRELALKRQKLTDRHPDVLQLEAEIAALEQEASASQSAPPAQGAVGQRLREALDETDGALREMKHDEDRLTQELAAVQDGRRVGPATVAGPAPRDFPAVQELYGSLLRRYEDAQIADSAEEALAPRLKLLDAAVAPVREAGPPRGRLMLFALLAALAAAVTVAALAERLDQSFRSLDDLRAFTRVPVLVTVPTLLTRSDRWRRRARVAVAIAGIALGVALLGLGSYRVFAQGYWLTAALERAR